MSRPLRPVDAAAVRDASGALGLWAAIVGAGLPAVTLWTDAAATWSGNAPPPSASDAHEGALPPPAHARFGLRAEGVFDGEPGRRALDWDPAPRAAGAWVESLADWAIHIGSVHPYWVEEARLFASSDTERLQRMAALCGEHGLPITATVEDDGQATVTCDVDVLAASLERLDASATDLRWWVWTEAGDEQATTITSRDDGGRAVDHDAWTSLTAAVEDVALDAVQLRLLVSSRGARIAEATPQKLRSGARLRVRLDLRARGTIDARTLLCSVHARDLAEMLQPGISHATPLPLLASGLPAGPGAVSGVLALDLASVRQIHRRGERAIYFAEDPSPEDIPAIVEANAVVTARGGRTSHAAVLAQQLGRPCVVGCEGLVVDRHARTVRAGNHSLSPGDAVTVDGRSGRVHIGNARIEEPALDAPVRHLLELADAHRRLGVRANADRASEARSAMQWGAEGIGLVRTEHMFLGTELVHAMRAVVLASGEEARQRALDIIRPAQAAVITELFAIVGDAPLTVRLLDPPLHEFLPANPDDLESVSARLGIPMERVQREVAHLRESNPMLGRRGGRVGITAPAIYDTQIEGILDAVERARAAGGRPHCEILVPFVVGPAEMRYFRDRIRARMAARGMGLAPAGDGEAGGVRIGAMIELPRACLLAGEIAAHADFLSFGTNDLTQTVYGFSRDDTAGFLPAYLTAGILPADPFEELDPLGVGELIDLACARARAVRPDITIGVCGEHAAHPEALRWLHSRPIDYVSCSPWRVPGARVAAARAALGCGG